MNTCRNIVSYPKTECWSLYVLGNTTRTNARCIPLFKRMSIRRAHPSRESHRVYDHQVTNALQSSLYLARHLYCPFIHTLRSLMNVVSQAMLDVKGIGLVPPNPPLSKPYMTGLLVGYAALSEYLWARVLTYLLQENNSTVNVLPHYAVIDLGFDMYVYPGEEWMAPAMNGTQKELYVNASTPPPQGLLERRCWLERHIAETV